MKAGKCRGCGKPVRETVGKCGYCKKCIAKAQAERKENEGGKGNGSNGRND